VIPTEGDLTSKVSNDVSGNNLATTMLELC
jgi:hypothetical protein